MQNATNENEELLTQQPTRKCCPGCKQVLGEDGLSKVPNPDGDPGT